MQKKPTTDGLRLSDEEDEFEPGESDNSQSHGQQGAAAVAQTQGGGKTPVLDNFSTDLTKACCALESLDPVVGREKEIQRVVEILGRRKKNNPILIGEPGVGKSAIVEGLAQAYCWAQDLTDAI